MSQFLANAGNIVKILISNNTGSYLVDIRSVNFQYIISNYFAPICSSISPATWVRNALKLFYLYLISLSIS